MNFEFNKLYFSLVKYYTKNGTKYSAHALYKDNDTEELLDLDTLKPILPYGSEEKYFEKSLIPFSEVLYKTRISWRSLRLGDALKMKESCMNYYFKFLNMRGISDISDLEYEYNTKLNKSKRK